MTEDVASMMPSTVESSRYELSTVQDTSSDHVPMLQSPVSTFDTSFDEHTRDPQHVLVLDPRPCYTARV